MPSVVFMRGVNVGGHKAFRPSVLTDQLTALRVVSVGAAGTFVVGADASDAEVRRAFLKHLPFDAQIMICPAREVIDLVKVEPFADPTLPKADKPFISVLEQRPRQLPNLPYYVPEGRDWQVGIIAVHRHFVATLMRRLGRRLLYPNEVVEKGLGVAATTRGWPTILRVREILDQGAHQRGSASSAQLRSRGKR